MKRSTCKILIGLAASFALFPAAITQAQNLVANGSFEGVQIGAPFYSGNPADVPNWTHTGVTGDALLWNIGYGSVTAGSGNQFVTMGGGYYQPSATSSWEQELTGLTPGETYLLSFQMAAEANYSGPQSLTVDFPSGSSTPAMEFTAQTPIIDLWHDWETKSLTFIATSSSVDLRFSATTSFDVGLDDVRVTLLNPTIAAVIDIEPGTFPNSINLGSRGNLPVAVLTRDNLDARMIDPTSILFGDPNLAGRAAPVRWVLEDVDGDGRLDLVIFFSMPGIVAVGALNKSSTMAELTGMTSDGHQFKGSDSVQIVR